MKQKWVALAAQASLEKGAARGKAGLVEEGGDAARGPVDGSAPSGASLARSSSCYLAFSLSWQTSCLSAFPDRVAK